MLGFLEGMKKTKAPQPGPQPSPQPALPENETWTVRLLSGSELTDITLEETIESSGEHIWRVGGGLAPAPEPATTPDGTVAAPPVPNPPQEPQATPIADTPEPVKPTVKLPKD